MSTINIEQFEKIVEFNIDNNIKRAILGLGPSGIGKSAVIKQITQKKNMGLIDLRLLLYTETDLKGIPFPNKEENRTCWLPNDILPDENRDRVFAFLTALMTATVPIGTGMFSVYINLAKTSYIFCVIGVVIVIFACMYGIIDRNK